MGNLEDTLSASACANNDTIQTHPSRPPLEGDYGTRFALLAQECESIERDILALVEANADPDLILRFLTQNLQEIHDEASTLISTYLSKTHAKHAHRPDLSRVTLEGTLRELRKHRAALCRWAHFTRSEFELGPPTYLLTETFDEDAISLSEWGADLLPLHKGKARHTNRAVPVVL